MPDREKVKKGLECCANERCSECPYHNATECVDALTPDALALLKEQEPRVMTLNELPGDYSRVVYIECESSKTQNVGIYQGTDFYHDGTFAVWKKFLCIGDSEYLFRLSDRYGKTWRCWTSRPTKEQRKAVPWEPPKEEDDGET